MPHITPPRNTKEDHGQGTCLFLPGRMVATPGALNALTEAGQSPLEFIAHHPVRGVGRRPARGRGRQQPRP